jgi:hypothetical protein
MISSFYTSFLCEDILPVLEQVPSAAIVAAKAHASPTMGISESIAYSCREQGVDSINFFFGQPLKSLIAF